MVDGRFEGGILTQYKKPFLFLNMVETVYKPDFVGALKRIYVDMESGVDGLPCNVFARKLLNTKGRGEIYDGALLLLKNAESKSIKKLIS